MTSVVSVAVEHSGQYHSSMPVQGDPNKLRAGEAATLLGVVEWQFYQLVKQGYIKRHVPKWPAKLGYYMRDDVLALKARMDSGEFDREREQRAADKTK